MDRAALPQLYAYIHNQKDIQSSLFHSNTPGIVVFSCIHPPCTGHRTPPKLLQNNAYRYITIIYLYCLMKIKKPLWKRKIPEKVKKGGHDFRKSVSWYFGFVRKGADLAHFFGTSRVEPMPKLWQSWVQFQFPTKPWIWGAADKSRQK